MKNSAIKAGFFIYSFDISITACSTLNREQVDGMAKSYAFLISNLKAPFSVASSYNELTASSALSACQLRAKE